MNQVDSDTSGHRPWWQGWFTDWSLCGQDRRNLIRASLCTAGFCILLAISGLPYGTPESGEFYTFSIWRWILTLVPIVPGLAAIPAWYRFLNNAEELLKRIYTEAAATGFAVALISFLSLGIVGRICGEEDGANASALAFILTIFSFCFSLQYRLRKYSE